MGSVLTSQLILQLIVSARTIQLKLILPDIQLGRPLLIKDNTLSVTLKFPSDIMISVSTTVMMQLPSKEELGFTACIGVVVTPTPGIYMSLVMVAPWKRAFGIEALTILQLGGSVTIVSTPPYLKAIELNAGMALGPMSIIGGVGLDLTNPKGIFFYAKVNGLTMGNVLKIFKPSLELPSFLADTGFEGEASISFTVSPNGAVSLTGVDIPFGLRAKGTLNLFGYKAKVDINIGKTGFKYFSFSLVVCVFFSLCLRMSNLPYRLVLFVCPSTCLNLLAFPLRDCLTHVCPSRTNHSLINHPHHHTTIPGFMPS